MATKKRTNPKSPKSQVHKPHDLPLQQKLKDKGWDPIKEILEITDEYEEGTPKREPGKDYWGACCLESQDVDVAQNPERKRTHGTKTKEQKPQNRMKPPIPK
jgi:hypothetical protein